MNNTYIVYTETGDKVERTIEDTAKHDHLTRELGLSGMLKDRITAASILTVAATTHVAIDKLMIAWNTVAATVEYEHSYNAKDEHTILEEDILEAALGDDYHEWDYQLPGTEHNEVRTLKVGDNTYSFTVRDGYIVEIQKVTLGDTSGLIHKPLPVAYVVDGEGGLDTVQINEREVTKALSHPEILTCRYSYNELMEDEAKLLNLVLVTSALSIVPTNKEGALAQKKIWEDASTIYTYRDIDGWLDRINNLSK